MEYPSLCLLSVPDLCITELKVRFANYYKVQNGVEVSASNDNFAKITTQHPEQLVSTQSQKALNEPAPSNITLAVSLEGSTAGVKLPNNLTIRSQVEPDQGSNLVQRTLPHSKLQLLITSQPSGGGCFDAETARMSAPQRQQPLKMTSDEGRARIEQSLFTGTTIETTPWTIGIRHSSVLNRSALTQVHNEAGMIEITTPPPPTTTATAITVTESPYGQNIEGMNLEVPSDTGYRPTSLKKHFSSTTVPYLSASSRLAVIHNSAAAYNVEHVPVQMPMRHNTRRKKLSKRVKQPPPTLPAKNKTRICKDSHKVMNRFSYFSNIVVLINTFYIEI